MLSEEEVKQHEQEYCHKYYLKNRDELLEKHRKYREENRSEINLRRRKHRNQRCKMMKTCAWCDEPFETNNPNQKYCSRRCCRDYWTYKTWLKDRIQKNALNITNTSVNGVRGGKIQKPKSCKGCKYFTYYHLGKFLCMFGVPPFDKYFWYDVQIFNSSNHQACSYYEARKS